MLLSRPQALGSALLAALVLLGACGFRPLYGSKERGAAAAELAAVEIKPIADRVGQQLHNLLLDRINPRGRPAEPRYILKIRLTQGIERLAVRKTAFSTRANLRLTAIFDLEPAAGGDSLVSGTSLAISSYNILNSEFATLTSEKDARTRATGQLAEDIRTRLAVFFAQRKAAGGSP